MKLRVLILALALALSSHAVWAKRLGGGGSLGKQSSQVTQRNTSPAPVSPAPGGAAVQKPAAPTGGAAVPAPAKRPWGAIFGGVAAGLGLAWLASSLGLGAGFANVLLMLLVVVLVLTVVSAVRRSRSAARQGDYAFVGGDTSRVSAQAALPRDYSPRNVGNDASARPWEHDVPATEAGQLGVASGASLIGSALSGPQSWGIPADFDTTGFLQTSKANFISLQTAWDRADIPALRAMMTDEMIEQIQAQLAEREGHTGVAANLTEVIKLEAQLLGIEDMGEAYMASVEFDGLIREEPGAGPNPFREVWNITRPKNGSVGWLVAGVQAMQ